MYVPYEQGVQLAAARVLENVPSGHCVQGAPVLFPNAPGAHTHCINWAAPLAVVEYGGHGTGTVTTWVQFPAIHTSDRATLANMINKNIFLMVLLFF